MTPQALKIRDPGIGEGGKFVCELDGIPIHDVVSYKIECVEPGILSKFTVSVWVGEVDAEVIGEGKTVDHPRQT